MIRDATLCAQTLQRAGLYDRLDAAARAGFGSIGLTLTQYRESGVSDRQFQRLLDQHGLLFIEIEQPWDWAADDREARADGDQLVHVVETFGCRQLNAVQFVPHPYEELVERFAALCDRIVDVDVALEFMPFSELPALADAWSLLVAADRPNARLLLDTWHYERGRDSAVTLRAVPPGRIGSVQLNDPLPVPVGEPRDEARHLRQLPGPRSTALLAELAGLGVRARLSAEVWSDELEALDPREAAQRVATALDAAVAATNGDGDG